MNQGQSQLVINAVQSCGAVGTGLTPWDACAGGNRASQSGSLQEGHCRPPEGVNADVLDLVFTRVNWPRLHMAFLFYTAL